MNSVQVKRLSDTAILPKKATAGAVGYDLCASADMRIEALSQALVATDLSMIIPEGMYGRIAPRSGLALKHGISVGGGVIDPDYRGAVGVILFNFGKVPFEIKVGDRIAQMVFERVALPDIVEVKGELGKTDRGESGFGSTGVNLKAATAEDKQKKGTGCAFAATAITGVGLFLGGKEAYDDIQALKQNDICAIVNLSTESSMSRTEEHLQFREYFIGLEDSDNPLDNHRFGSMLNSILMFIERNLNTGHNVLVCCHQGNSRSAAVCIAYLMKIYSPPLSLKAALKWVQEDRPTIRPNNGLMRELIKYEQVILGPCTPSFDVKDYPEPILMEI